MSNHAWSVLPKDEAAWKGTIVWQWRNGHENQYAIFPTLKEAKHFAERQVNKCAVKKIYMVRQP